MSELIERLTRTELGETTKAVMCNYNSQDCNDSCMYGFCKWSEKALQKLKEFEDTNHTPEQIKEFDKLYLEKCKEVNKLKDESRWIPFAINYDDDYKIEMLQGKIPDEEEEILVTDGDTVWSDTFMRDGIECYLDSGCDLIDTVIAWKPLPQPYKEASE